jgi:phage gpG-like protein
MSGDSFGLGVFAQLGQSSNGGAEGMARRLDAMVRQSRAGAAGYAAVGHRAMFLVTRGLRENVGHWPSPGGWPRAFRRGGQPLRDTKRLSNSIAYRATAQGVSIGTNVPYARILNRGGTITPKGRFLLLPLSPPLSQSEVRAWPRGKSGIEARYPESFFLLKGPEGTGIYRPSRRRIATRIRSKKGNLLAAPSAKYGKGRAIERIAAAVRRVRIKPYGYLQWRPAWVRDLAQRYAKWHFDPSTASRFPAAGGNPDVGKRGGGA